MTIALAPELEQRVKTEATRTGETADLYVSRLVDEHITQAELQRQQELLALVQSWIDNPSTEEEGTESDEEFFCNLANNRVRFREVTLPE